MARSNSLKGMLVALGAALMVHAALGCSDDSAAPGGAGAGGGPAGGGEQGGASAGGAGQGGEGAGEPIIPGEHPRIYLNDTERARLSAALQAPTESATRFKAYVDLALGGGEPYDFQGWHAALVYALTGDEAYAELAIAHVDAMVAEDESRVAGDTQPLVAADSYLEVGPRVGDMAMVYDWCFELVSEEQRARWIAWGNQAVFNVWHHEDASWGGQPMPWSGWAVDDPVNNYYFSFLRATMLLGLATYAENPEAPGFVDFFRQTKIEGQLLDVYGALEGGGSREGTGYGVAMANLFRIYDVWQKSTGEDLSGLTEHARGSIAHMLHSMAPTLDRIAPIGDHARDSSAALFDYHRDYLLVLGSLYPSDPASLAARTALAASSVPEASQGFMRFSDFLYDPAGLETAPLSSLYPAYHAQGVGHLFVRSSWEADATWASFIAGPYDQSHAHHDQGSLTLYKDEWLAYDANIDSQSGIRLEEELHNLVRIESQGSVARMVEGATPSLLLALQDEPAASFFAADLTNAYGSSELVTSVRREVVFVKPSFFVVRDRVRTSAAGATRVFQLNTPIQPSVSAGRASIDGASSSLDLFVVRPASVTPSVVDWQATDGDMNGGYRLEVATSGQEEAVFLTVLSIDGEVASASASGATGVSIDASSGDFTVTFAADGVGATLESNGATSTFSAAVEQLPLLAD